MGAFELASGAGFGLATGLRKGDRARLLQPVSDARAQAPLLPGRGNPLFFLAEFFVPGHSLTPLASSILAKRLHRARAVGLHAALRAAHRRRGLRHVELLPVTQQERLALTRRELCQRLLDERDNLPLLELFGGGRPRRLDVGFGGSVSSGS